MTEVRPYQSEDKVTVLALSLRSWEPVFSALESEVSSFVYECFYPRGWRIRQEADLAEVLDEEAGRIDVAVIDSQVVGWVCTRLHPEDDMGEVYVLAVDPDHQRQGIATALMDRSFERIRDAGLRMAMVETGGDSGHAPSRATYEAAGFQRWPVARYFKDLMQN
ncbi:GNAT family N-acetyltransferase [Mobilicoccus caccae]|uniref:GNAT family N-acetyltransferase n=1 Tax=Mobilicoccus caccae TaxID=1859295 RepID=A0ABQ6ISN6_9MICO|nr:GNAT family N-acetyltransferase [Mobilicoccus caccae]GMA40504.1 GNAT family N-acetyltransferase [Mobilicoccus caccae]